MKRCSAQCACVEGHDGPHALLPDAIVEPLWRGHPPTSPKRRFVLKIEIGADNWKDALADLNHIASILEDVDDPARYRSIMGGDSMCHVVEVHDDPTMTHERYIEELHAYLNALEAPHG